MADTPYTLTREDWLAIWTEIKRRLACWYRSSIARRGEWWDG